MNSTQWNETFRTKPELAFTQWLEVVADWYPGMPLNGEYLNALEGISALYPDVLEPVDWLPFYLVHQIGTHPMGRLDGGQVTFGGLASTVTTLLTLMPKFIPHTRLFNLQLFRFAEDVIAKMIGWPEFDSRNIPPEPRRFIVEWRNGSWSNAGATVLGQLSRISTRERAQLKTSLEPYWKMTLSLPAWVIMTELEQHALVHHEMGHATMAGGRPKLRRHDIEEFAATAGRFGVVDPVPASVVRHAAAHPATRETWQEAGWDGEQGLLFTPFRAERSLKAL